MDEAQSMELRRLLEEAMAKKAPQAAGGMGFDQKMFDRAMSDPKTMEAGAELAGLMNDGTALGIMGKSGEYQVPNGGKLGWTEALSKGIDKGVGLYNILNSQKAKANALRSLAVNGGGAKQSAIAGGAMTPPAADAFPVNLNDPRAMPLA